MLSITDLRKDVVIQLDGQPYKVTDYQHTQLGRGGAVVKTKLKNLLSGNVLTKTFKGNERVEPARLDKVDTQYLYSDDSRAYFMDTQNYEQFSVGLANLQDRLAFLNEGQKVLALSFNNQLVDVALPQKIKLRVKHTEPGVRGDTAMAAVKPAVLETGLKLQVPLFINDGDMVILDTRTGKYLGRG